MTDIVSHLRANNEDPETAADLRDMTIDRATGALEELHTAVAFTADKLFTTDNNERRRIVIADLQNVAKDAGTYLETSRR